MSGISFLFFVGLYMYYNARARRKSLTPSSPPMMRTRTRYSYSRVTLICLWPGSMGCICIITRDGGANLWTPPPLSLRAHPRTRALRRSCDLSCVVAICFRLLAIHSIHKFSPLIQSTYSIHSVHKFKPFIQSINPSHKFTFKGKEKKMKKKLAKALRLWLLVVFPK